MSDCNHIGFAGDGKGIIWMTIGGVTSLLFAAEEPGIRHHYLTKVSKPAGVVNDLIKLSGTSRFHLHVEEADGSGCIEDTIDCNHCNSTEVSIGTLRAAQTYCMTIKGGSWGIKVSVDKQIGHGKETDYDLGNFSDQGNSRTTGVTLNIATEDGSPVQARCLTADSPTIANPSQLYKVALFNQGWFYPLFNALKDFLRAFGVKI